VKEHLSYFLFTFTSLFAIVNPLGPLTFYAGFTENLDADLAKMVARRASIAAFSGMFFFAVGGDFLFDFFNVSVDSLRVVGGVLFFIMGYDMLQGKESRTKKVSPSEQISLQDIRVRAITPLGIPLICGPGAITVMTVLSHETSNVVQTATLHMSALLVCTISYIALISSRTILKWIGESGQKVFIRIMGLILMMIAVEFFFKGIHPYIQKLITPA
jgi:multiple antibiotic resistance protein